MRIFRSLLYAIAIFATPPACGSEKTEDLFALTLKELMHIKKSEKPKGIFTDKTLGKSKNEFRVGVIIPLSAYPEYSKQTIALTEATARHINRIGGVSGKDLRVIYADDGGDRDLAVNLAKKLHQKYNIQALIGPTSTSRVKSVANKYSIKHNLLLISAGANGDALAQLEDNDSVFQMMNVASSQGQYVASSLLQQLAVNNVAVIYRRTDYANQVKDAFDRVWNSHTGKIAPALSVSDIVSYKSFNLSTEFRQLLSRSPQAIFFIMSNQEAIDIITQLEQWYTKRKKTLPLLIASEGIYDLSYFSTMSESVVSCSLFALPYNDKNILKILAKVNTTFKFPIQNIEPVYARDALVLIAFFAEHQLNNKRPISAKDFRLVIDKISQLRNLPLEKSQQKKLNMLSRNVTFDKYGFNTTTDYALWSVSKIESDFQLNYFSRETHRCLNR